jgi:hypothetical protein
MYHSLACVRGVSRCHLLIAAVDGCSCCLLLLLLIAPAAAAMPPLLVRQYPDICWQGGPPDFKDIGRIFPSGNMTFAGVPL